MAKVNLQKQGFNKFQYNNIVDTKFKDLGISNLNEALQQEDTVDVFFEMYNALFYQIPAEGEQNSHAYLAKTSGEYINFNSNEEDIAALRTEITGLREQLLQEQIATVEALTGTTINITGSNENVVSTGTSNNALSNSGLGSGTPGTGGNAGGVY